MQREPLNRLPLFVIKQYCPIALSAGSRASNPTEHVKLDTPYYKPKKTGQQAGLE